MLGGYRAAGCRSHRANVEARASGDFGYGPSPQGSRLRKHLGGARKPHAVALITFKSCSTACVATLSTCNSAVTSNLAQAHVRALCFAGRSLEQLAFAVFPAQPLIGSHSAVAVVHTWPLCPRAAGQHNQALMRHLYGFQLVSRDYAASTQFAR